MPKKTLYISENDMGIWEKAESMADSESLSKLVTKALRTYVLSKENGGPYERIELEVAKVNDHNFIIGSRNVAFQGRWLVEGEGYDIYETSKGQLLFYSVDNGYGFYNVYEDLDAAAEETENRNGELDVPKYSGDLLAEVAEALGNEDWVQELDI